MDSIEQLVAQLTAAQSGVVNVANERERDGNCDDVLFRIDQAAVSIQGGNTLQASYSPLSVAPNVVMGELAGGRLPLGLVLLAMLGLLGWLAFRR
jgi:hypothetical protein